MSNHTPGPWFGQPQGDANDYCILRKDGGRTRWVLGFRQNGEIWTAEQIANLKLIEAAPDLLAVLQRYVNAYPAFRMKPIGAPGSPARIEQENLMALEDAAKAAIAKAEGRS